MINPLAQHPVEREVSRILQSEGTQELVSQLRQMNSYQNRIEEELMIKTTQISKLQNYLRQEISNIQLIVDENSQLKKEIENYQRQIGQREEENGALQAEVKHLTQMNKESNSIIKRLDDRTCELEQELNAKSYRPATLEWSGQTDPIKQEKQEDSSIATTPLLKKIGELEEIVMKLRFEKNEILSKIRSMEGSEANFSSIMESEPDETSMEGRLTLDAVLELIIQGNIREIKFRGQILDGKKTGRGVCEYQDGIIYDGHFHEGKRHGLGTLQINGQEIYRGQWREGVMEGKGRLKMLEGEIESYEGQFCEGRLEGYGCMLLKSGKRITACWREGKIVGSCLESVGAVRRLRKPQLIECY